MRVAVLIIVFAACGSRSDEPRAPVLVPIEGSDLRCATNERGSGIGLELDGRCLTVQLVAAGWDSSPPEARDATCGDGATFLHESGFGSHHIARIDGDGVVKRVAVPATNDARLTFIDVERPLLVAVLNSVGTMVFDARTLEGIAGWERMGGWFNATTSGAAASPDGHWIVVPDPYGMRVDVVRLADLTLVGYLPVGDSVARDEGPGLVRWSSTGLEVTTFGLPYE